MGWPPVDTVAHQWPGPRRALPARDAPVLGYAKRPSASLPEPPVPRHAWTSAKLSRPLASRQAPVLPSRPDQNAGCCDGRHRPAASLAGWPSGWRGSHPRGSGWYANGCRTGRQALGWPGAGAECCGRAAGPQPLTLRPPRPRRTADASAASMTGTSRIARSVVPGVSADGAPLAVLRLCQGRIRLSQDRSSHDCDSSCSSRGMRWPLVSFVNVANIDLRRGSLAWSERSIRPRTRCWRAGRLIKSAPDPAPRRGADRGRRRVSAGPRSQPRSRSTRGPARGRGMACWCI
jgi:hypothetical protein